MFAQDTICILFLSSRIVKKFVSDLRQVGGLLRVLTVSSTNKTDHHDITEILLKVALNTIKQTKLSFFFCFFFFFFFFSIFCLLCYYCVVFF